MLLLLALLPAALAASRDAPRVAPHAMVVAGVGIPNLLHGHAEIFLSNTASVELGGGWGLLPWTLTAGARWSPTATCWGCWEGHGLRLSPGITATVFPGMAPEGLVTLNLDLAWVWRSPGGVGATAGVRAGAGPALGSINGRLKVEPGIELVPLQAGIIF